MFAKYGIKVIIDRHSWHAAWDVRHMPIEPWEDFIVQSHDFFYSLLSHGQSRLLQTSYWDTERKNEGGTGAVRENEIITINTWRKNKLNWNRSLRHRWYLPLLFKRPKNVSSLSSFLSDSISAVTSISIKGIAIDRFHKELDMYFLTQKHKIMRK